MLVLRQEVPEIGLAVVRALLHKSKSVLNTPGDVHMFVQILLYPAGKRSGGYVEKITKTTMTANNGGNSSKTN